MDVEQRTPNIDCKPFQIERIKQCLQVRFRSGRSFSIVVLHVDGAALAESADVPAGTSSATEGSLAASGQTLLDEAGGMQVSQETARRLACDSATVEMRHGAAGEILDVGRRRRTVSQPLWRGERLNREWAVSLLWQPRADAAETASR